MQKIFSKAQIKACDAYTITHEPIASIDLMERAALTLFETIVNEFDAPQYDIYCGQGNNGGDGLALARILSLTKKQVNVFVIKEKEQGAIDFETNFAQLKHMQQAQLHCITNKNEFVISKPEAIIIDALLGTGLKGIANGLMKEAIDFINYQPNVKVAIDVPSGLLCDEPIIQKSSIVLATATLTFQFMKLAFLFPESQPYCGRVKLLNIGLSTKFIKDEASNYFIIDNDHVKSLFEPRKSFSHKGLYGHALLICGSFGKYGAALLCAKACSRSGAGLITLHGALQLQQALNIYLPSAMYSDGGDEKMITKLPDLQKYNAVAVGCGLGKAKETANFLKLLIQQCDVPLLLDADAINILAENKTWLSFLPVGSILTPHPKEFERLCGKWSNSFERLEMQKDFSVKYNCFVVLKGAYTCISTPQGNFYFNPTGNPGMAKGGSGDALTGVITAMLAQGLNRAEACIAGVYIHGFAGDLAANKYSQYGMLPEDLIDELGHAFKLIEQSTAVGIT